MRRKEVFPITETQFIEAMKDGYFVDAKHRGLVALLYHTGVRISEALRTLKEQFQILNDIIYYDVLRRLKKGLHTPPLNIPLAKPFAKDIFYSIVNTADNNLVWPYCRKTGYNIVARVLTYPHHLRLTRITNLFRLGFTIDQVRSWTGHKTLNTLSFYVGYADIEDMGKV